ncbi:MAG: hypothetical protein J5809_05525 [Selenomonadaceae bacterium]|nr:hypothetical protein [Selenomonadaceae bacterium]
MHALYVNIQLLDNSKMDKNCAAYVDSHYSERWCGEEPRVFLNRNFLMTPEEWVFTIAHCELHLAFGHFDADKIPANCDLRLWNMACDIYVTKFLAEAKIGEPRCSLDLYAGPTKDELSIYEYLQQHRELCDRFHFGTAAPNIPDMKNLDKPFRYTPENPSNIFARRFAEALASRVSRIVSDAGGYDFAEMQSLTEAQKAAKWFLNHYPLLGGLASAFKVVEDLKYCQREEIQIAAVDVTRMEIYVNPAAGLTNLQLRFVLAHEFLHAGLQHHERRQGRDPYLWNVACDYVINGWLWDMRVGRMPPGVLFDETLKKMSAEEIYDKIVNDLKKFSKLETLRGYGKGDIISDPPKGFKPSDQTSLDEFYKSALQNGLEYHTENSRGFIPAGLIEEIRALAMPPIPWDVELGKWFDVHFSPLESKRTYARPSRRQGSTPDIPRPSYIPAEISDSRTFGVVVDTSGSMSAKLIGYALGAIASYSAAKEVPVARVVFCDAQPYDAGYISPEDIAGRVEVKGRGGTILQPGVDLLTDAEDFPKDAPILIITDGWIESDLNVKREHAFLIPRGRHLPFKPTGKLFHFSE